LRRERVHALVERALATADLLLDPLESAAQQQGRLVAGEEALAAELPVWEPRVDSELGNALDGCCRPVIRRHVGEGELAGVVRQQGVGATGRAVRPLEHPVDQQGGLVPGQRAFAEERPVRESDVESTLGQASDRSPAPLLVAALRQSHGQSQSGRQHRQQPLHLLAPTV